MEKVNKRTKKAVALVEVTFFRFFAPVSIIGAEELGGPTFVSDFGFYFFLLLPVLDTLRCYLYYNSGTNDHDQKENWNKVYYASKMVFNTLGCLLMLLGNLYFQPLIVPGQAIFIGGVIGLTALEYTFKALGAAWLEDNQSPEKTNRRFKNATLAVTMLTALVGMSLLMFFPEVQYAHEPLGWFIIVLSNTIPITAFALKGRDPTLLFSSAVVLAGIGLLLSDPKRSVGLDHAIGTEVGIGLALVLGGFLIATVIDTMRWWKAPVDTVKKSNFSFAQPDIPNPQSTAATKPSYYFPWGSVCDKKSSSRSTASSGKRSEISPK